MFIKGARIINEPTNLNCVYFWGLETNQSFNN